MERVFLSQKGSGGWRGVKEKSSIASNIEAVKDGTVPSVTVAAGNTQEENVGQSSTGLTASESGPDVSFASLLIGESKRKGLSFRTLITQARNEANVAVPLESIRAVSERYANSVYSFFLRKRVAYPVVANYVKLYGAPVTAFTKDGLSTIAMDIGTPLMLDSYTSHMCTQSWGMSSYARALIEIRADAKLKDTIVVAMPKLIGEGPVAKKATANASGNKKKSLEPTKEVSNSNPFDVLNSVVNDDDSTSTTPFVDKIGKLEKLIIDGKATLMDNDDPYDDDMYEGQDLPDKIQDICDNLDIRFRGSVLDGSLDIERFCSNGTTDGLHASKPKSDKDLSSTSFEIGKYH
ncbi:hypothetical protein Tco_0389177 [Tanacetum coccineum]